MTNFAKRLLSITDGCRPDMREPDEQGVSCKVVGSHFDNAYGDDPEGNLGEMTVGITRGDTREWFNLASLIALARIGAMAKSPWQPIETAPKDGTKIIGITNTVEIVKFNEEVWPIDVMGDQATAWASGWWGIEVDSECEPEKHSALTGIYAAKNQPTHWMPMPTGGRDE